jgi:hypothetical protein
MQEAANLAPTDKRQRPEALHGLDCLLLLTQ